jgi:ketosteroid isomerase-like protein
MSQENVEIVRAAFEALNRGDIDAAVKDAALDFEFDFSRSVSPMRGVFALGQIKEFWDGFSEVWQSMRWEAEEFIEGADQVLTPTSLYVQGREGVKARGRAAWIWTFDGGKIARLTFYQEKREALEAAGRLPGRPAPGSR